MESNDLLKKLNVLKNHKPIIVNWGKSKFTGQEILEESYWDEEKGMYGSETGWWDMNLLIEIAKGEVKGYSIELGE